jgi:hypothetical protein
MELLLLSGAAIFEDFQVYLAVSIADYEAESFNY